jgi:hypothetical protein
MNQTPVEEVGMTTSKPLASATRTTGRGSADFRRWGDGEQTVAPFRQNARRNTSGGRSLQCPGSIPVAPTAGPGTQAVRPPPPPATSIVWMKEV